MRNIQLYNGDCLNLLGAIPDKSIDMIFADLPFGTTQNKWDCQIDLDKLWPHHKRIIKDNGCIALWCQVPFNITLGASNMEWLNNI